MDESKVEMTGGFSGDKPVHLGGDEVVVKSQSRWPEITPEELLEMSEDQVLCGAVVKCLDGENKECYQTLEMADPEGVGLADYRRREIDTIKNHLETSDLVVMIGPSTAGKTETILLGEKSYFPLENTLIEGRREKIIYLALYLYEREGIEDLQDQLTNECQRDGVPLKEKELILCDEFSGSPEAVELVKYLRSLGKKVVLAMGGRRANQVKLDTLRQYETLSQIPVVEINIKPLNHTQMNEVLELTLEAQNRNRAERMDSDPDFGTQVLSDDEIAKIRLNWSAIQESSLPIHYWSAHRIAENLCMFPERFERTARRMSISLEEPLSAEKWKEILPDELAHLANVQTLELAKELIKMREEM